MTDDYFSQQTFFQVQRDYTVNEHGIITDPGKFEGEPLYVPYFYAFMMCGFEEEVICVEEEDRSYSIFLIRDFDVSLFPDLADFKPGRVALWTSDQGFAEFAAYNGEYDN